MLNYMKFIRTFYAWVEGMGDLVPELMLLVTVNEIRSTDAKFPGRFSHTCGDRAFNSRTGKPVVP